MRAQLIVALDLPTINAVPNIVDRLPDTVSWYKIGLELFAGNGPAVFDYLLNKGKNIFLDLKLHDIPRTVERAVKSIAAHNVAMITVHASGGKDMLKAAADAANTCSFKPKIVAVTTLTSLNQKDLNELDIQCSVAEHTAVLGNLAISCGLDGLVCSAFEAESLRKKFGDAPVLVTPGIRPAGTDAGDQKRIATPSIAVRNGSNFLVVGRPILEAENPASAVINILQEMQAENANEWQ
ncbi:MAG: orotidine-5'-phosphate decarboxylase [Lentisphaerae bacterium]|nr:orotidine-5'-phosphate decarboxylase [Lentisphaerota bacterium]